MATTAAIKLAYLVSHPIQYQAPLLRLIAAQPDIDLTVFFCSDHPDRDTAIGREDASDVPLLEGCAHEVLPAFGDPTKLSAWRPFNHGLAQRLRAGRFDVLWVHGYARAFHLAAIVAARAMGVKVLLRDEAHALTGQRGPLKRISKHLLFSALCRLCDGFLPIGSLNGRYYRDYGVRDEQLFFMPYAVDNALLEQQAAAARPLRGALRAKLGLAEDRPVILFAAKLIARKRPGDLLDAYMRLRGDASAPQPYLLFVGDGELRGALEKRAHSHRDVRFLGFRGQSELPGLYDLADVVVLPSDAEAWGLTVNEAMATGTAIIASERVGAAADLVREGENGHVVPTANIAALADALCRVLADRERCRAMGQRGREIIARWSFRQDVEGLRRALAAVTRAPSLSRAHVVEG